MNTYHVAQRFVAIEPALPEIESWVAARAAGPVACPAAACPEAACPEATIEDVFQGEGRLGLDCHRIDCRWSRQGYSLRVDGVGQFFISADGGWIRPHEAEVPRSSGDLAETVLGPAVTLALALQGVWCLHASAVETAGEVIAFVGESGAGKSTLARELPGLDPAFRRAADDVLPVALENGIAWALPRFPQLKLDRQPGSALPARLPLTRIFVLDPAPSPDGEVMIEPLEGYGAVLGLVRHTVAARLFTEDLLEKHLETCARLAQSVDVARLRFPHRPGVLPRVREAVLAQCSKCCS